MATVSSSVANAVTKSVQTVHAGLNFAFAAYNSGGNDTPFSGSVSDAIVMMYLPPRTRITNAFIGGVTQDGNKGFSLGDPGSNTRFAVKSISATARGVIWFEEANSAYSVSDDQVSYPLTLHLQNVTSTSGSMSVHVGVYFVKY